HVQFLPIPRDMRVSGSGTFADPAIRVGNAPQEVTLTTGTAFALPVVVWYGESYVPGLYSADEDPVLPREVFLDVPIWVTITRVDGRGSETVMDSRLGSVEPFYFFTPLDIAYDEPTSYGSTGAIYVQGIGFVHGPLPPGEYVMELHS